MDGKVKRNKNRKHGIQEFLMEKIKLKEKGKLIWTIDIRMRQDFCMNVMPCEKKTSNNTKYYIS